MRVLVVDDESLARSRLRELVLKLEPAAIVTEADNGRAALEAVERVATDVVLMDIGMPEMDGLQAASYMMTMQPPPAVIFTTADGNYALDAFGVNAVDYLLKPVHHDRLRQALAKTRRGLRRRRLDSVVLSAGGARSHLSINTRGRIQLVAVADIIYFLADNKYVSVRTAGQRFLTDSSLNDLEVEFGTCFVRMHRNSLVAMNAVRELEKDADERWSVVFKTIDDRLQVSRRRVAAVRRWSRRS